MFYKLNFKPEMRDYRHQIHFLTLSMKHLHITLESHLSVEFNADCKLWSNLEIYLFG